MTSPFTPEIYASIRLQGDIMVAFMELGMSEALARNAAEEAIHRFLTSKVVHPNTKRAYESLDSEQVVYD
jgi:hypothetical protein